MSHVNGSGRLRPRPCASSGILCGASHYARTMKTRHFSGRSCLCTFLCVTVLVAFLFGLCFVQNGFARDDAAATQPEGVVAHCFDGDTVKLTDRRIVRIAGIDTPELAHEKTREQFYARRAQQALHALVGGKKVRVVDVSVKGKDRYGRIVADLVLDDGRSVAEEMIRAGAAFFYPHRDLFPGYQETLKRAQRTAVQERIGLWGELLDMPLARDTYIGNQDSLRFFPSGCPQAQNIKPRTRIYFGTLMDAFLAGLAPARVCVFWPNASEE